MTQDEAELKEAGDALRQAREQAEALVKPPRDKLTELARAKYAGGMRKADILRAMGYVWSDRWLDTVLKDVEPPEGTVRRATPSKAKKRAK